MAEVELSFTTPQKNGKERSDSDDEDEHFQAPHQGWWDTFSNLFVLFFGSGTFALPWGFMQAGLLGGLVGILVVAAITYVTISMLVAAKRLQLKRLTSHASQRSMSTSPAPLFPSSRVNRATMAAKLQQSLSYAKIATHAFGTPRAGLLVKGLTSFSSLGACGGYITFIVGILLPIIHRAGKTLQMEAQAWASELTATVRLNGTNSSSSFDDGDGTVDHTGTVSWRLGGWLMELSTVQLTVLVVLTCLIPMSFVRSFRGLANTTAFGNVVLLCAVTAIFYDGYERFGFHPVSEIPHFEYWPTSLANYSVYVAPCIYLFTVHYCALPIEAESEPNVEHHISPHELAHERSALREAMERGEEQQQQHQQQQQQQRQQQQRQRTVSFWERHFKGFDGALLLALFTSAILNAVVGGMAYYFYIQDTRLVTDPMLDQDGHATVVQGCEEQICDVVVKNVKPGFVQLMISVALCLNLSLTYVLMLAPSRQYIESALIIHLTKLYPTLYSKRGYHDVHDHADLHASEEDAVDDPGRWIPGEAWGRAVTRNVLRAVLVILTAFLSGLVPHFALLSGFVGGISDTAQSLVLPPLIYRREKTRRVPKVMQRTAAQSNLLLNIVCIFLAVFGLAFMVFATDSNVHKLLDQMHSHPSQ